MLPGLACGESVAGPTASPFSLDRRLALLHENVRRHGTISNTVAAATTLTGTIRRAKPASMTPVASTA
jgi:hypothetical protein